MDYLDLGEIPAGPSLFSELRSCVKVEVDVLDRNSPHCLCGLKTRTLNRDREFIVQELCESRGGRPGLSVLTSLLVSLDVKLY